MKRFALPLLLIGVVMAAAPALADTFAGYVPGRLILVLEDDTFPVVDKSGDVVGVDLEGLDALAKRHGVRDLEQLYPAQGAPSKSGLPDLRLHWAASFPEHLDLDRVRDDFLDLPEVAEVWKDEMHYMTNVPNDPQLNNQWFLRNTVPGGKDIRAVGGWAETYGDTNIVIAIVDSGVAWDHPDLGGPHPDSVGGAIWTNWTEYYGSPGVDDDNNGKIDDIRGWDFVNLSPSAGWPGEDMQFVDNDPYDFESHGTACAGVAAAITDNGVGVAGVARGCKIMPVRVGYLPAGETLGVVVMSYASAGMIYAASNGAHVINCSWGSSSYLSFAVTHCVDEGAIVVTAAGNDDDTVASYLNTHPDVLGVAATTSADTKATFSSYGTWVECSAPGVNITSTWYDHASDTLTYGTVQGTSFSSPITCGALALIWSANPGWSRTQVSNLLLNTCDDIDGLNPGYEGQLGAGRINLLRALGDSFQKVPEEFEYITDAFNMASPGDTIAIKASTPMTGPIVVPATEFHVLGGWDDTWSTRDPVGTPTVITANVSNTALQVSGGATTALVIDGFRCTGGGGKNYNGIPDSGDFGGGVVLNGTSPTLRNIDVTGNDVGDASNFGGGGGVLLYNSSALLENVHVHGNSAVHGAGLYVSGGAPTLRDCVIEDNTSTVSLTAPLGGGIFAHATDLTLENVTISGHDGVNTGGGVYAVPGTGSLSLVTDHTTITNNNAKVKGGGLYVGGGALTMLGDVVSANGYTGDATFMSGGGVATENATVVIDSLVAEDNAAHSGGGIHQLAGSLDLTASVVARNSAVFFAGGLYSQDAASGSVDGNTFTANSGGSASGGVYLFGSSLPVSNNLVAFNTGGAGQPNGINVVSATPTFSCNDVYGNDGTQYGGVTDPTGSDGNISVDPIFCDAVAGDYTLRDDSPCHVDNAGACGQIGALGQGCTQGTGVEDGPGDAVPTAFRVEPNFPNPFNPVTTIRFALPEPGQVDVRIYDVSGRLVRVLVDEAMTAAVHTVTWSGDDDRGRPLPSGVYFYKVTAPGHRFVDRMALVK